MTQREKMKKSLMEKVVPFLIQKGFSGKYPNYNRKYDNRIEILSFMTNKWGNSFLVEISTIFPDETTKELRNFYCSLDELDLNNLDTYITNKRYRLDGIIDGWFYYTDVFKSKMKLGLFRNGNFYNPISEKKALTYEPNKNEILVQKSSDELYDKISDEIILQMEKAFIWWEKHNTPQKMKKH